MALPRPSKSASELWGSLKDKISNRGHAHEHDEYYDDEYQEGYYDEYRDDQADEYDAYDYDGGYDDYRESYRSRTPRARLEERYTGSAPHLVSSEDVRATSPAYQMAQAARTASFSRVNDALAQEDQQREAGFDVPMSTYGDFVSPYKRDASAHTAATGSGMSTHMSAYAGANSASTGVAASAGTALRTSGLDQLFSPTTGTSASGGHGSGSNSDPYAAYANNTGYSHLPTRGLSIIRPVKYQDVEGIASALKAGSVAVLVLRVTNDTLAKRVLDFSFGVASALDARVDCVAEKVFVVARGEGLSLDERRQLHKQGVL